MESITVKWGLLYKKLNLCIGKCFPSAFMYESDTESLSGAVKILSTFYPRQQWKYFIMIKSQTAGLVLCIWVLGWWGECCRTMPLGLSLPQGRKVCFVLFCFLILIERTDKLRATQQEAMILLFLRLETYLDCL